MQKEIARTLKTNLPGEFESAVRWLEKLGIDYSRTRFGRYKETLAKVESARQAPAARIQIEPAFAYSCIMHRSGSCSIGTSWLLI